jgi:CheY-like chemotaxis protein
MHPSPAVPLVPAVPPLPPVLRAPTPLTRETHTRPGALQPLPAATNAPVPAPQDFGVSGFGSPTGFGGLPPSSFTPLEAGPASSAAPAAPSYRAPRPVAARETVPVRTSGVVLMCDDDEVSRVFMAELLQRAGYAVVTAANARQALNIWQSGGVRAVITDLVMAGMDGMALVNALRQAEEGQAERTVVIVCSGSAPPPLSGPDPQSYDAFLPKPVQGQVLARTLARLLGPPAMPQAVRA